MTDHDGMFDQPFPLTPRWCHLSLFVKKEKKKDSENRVSCLLQESYLLAGLKRLQDIDQMSACFPQNRANIYFNYYRANGVERK